MNLFRGTLGVLIAASILASSIAMADEQGHDRRNRNRGDRHSRDRGNPNDLGHFGERRNDDWQRDYIGTPNFSLRDDQHMREHLELVRKAAHRLEHISEAVDKQEKIVERIEKEDWSLYFGTGCILHHNHKRRRYPTEHSRNQ